MKKGMVSGLFIICMLFIVGTPAIVSAYWEWPPSGFFPASFDNNGIVPAANNGRVNLINPPADENHSYYKCSVTQQTDHDNETLSRYPIIYPDNETRKRWLQEYSAAPVISLPKDQIVAFSGGSHSVLHHISYVPGERNQKPLCGNCWVWAGTGLMEIALHVQNGIFDRLSVQYFNSNYHDGGTSGEYACCGGILPEFIDLYKNKKIAIPWSNTNASWKDNETECPYPDPITPIKTSVPAHTISVIPNYAISNISYSRIFTRSDDQSVAIANIKNVIRNDEGVQFDFKLPDLDALKDFWDFWDYQPETAIWNFSYCGKPFSSGGGHSVLVVGYNDTDSNNRYWEMLNSWGIAHGNRSHGLFRVNMTMNYNCTYPDPYLGITWAAFDWQTLNITYGIPNILWQRSLGGSSLDIANSVKQTSDGGYIIAGYSYSNDGNVSGHHWNADYWVVKLSSTGTIDWQRSLGGSDNEEARSVDQTTDGGYIVAGYTASNDGDVTGYHGGYGDYWVVKLSPAGTIEWQRSLGGSRKDDAYSVIQTPDGGSIIAGYSFSTDGNVTGHHGSNSYPDYWVVKLSSTGTIDWQRSLGGSLDDVAYSIAQTQDSGYIVAGYSYSIDGDVIHHNHMWSQDYWVVKLTPTGTIEWQRTIGGFGGDIANSIEQTSDGGYIVAGYSSSNDGDVTGNHGQQDYWMVKLTPAGSIEWQRSLGGSSNDVAYSVKQTSDNGYIVAGEAYSNNGDVTGNHGQQDYWVVKLSSIGTIDWQRSLGGSLADLGRSIDQTLDGGYIVAGGALSTDGDVAESHGSWDFWLVKLNAASTLPIPSPVPIIKFNTNVSSGYAPLAVRFIDQSTGLSLTRWNWSFGDGTWFNTTVASLKNPSHVYTAAGTYSAKLIVCNNSGCNTTTPVKTVMVTALSVPTIKFVTNVSSGNSPLAVKFTDISTGSPTKWNWSFGDGTWFNTTVSTLKSPAHIYSSAGTYTAKLIACNAAGCNTTGLTKTITVTSFSPPIIKFMTNVSSGNAPLAVKFTDQSTGNPTKWNWSFGDGTWFNTTLATQKSSAHTYSSAGTYTVKLIACNAVGCNTTAPTKTITVTTLTKPIVKFVSNRTSGTAPLPVKFIDLSTGSPTDWRWGFGDGSWFNTTVVSLKNPTHIYTVPGSFPSRLIACNAAGCNTTAPTRTITVS